MAMPLVEREFGEGSGMVMATSFFGAGLHQAPKSRRADQPWR